MVGDSDAKAKNPISGGIFVKRKKISFLGMFTAGMLCIAAIGGPLSASASDSSVPESSVSITPKANDNGWQRQNVLVQLSGEDSDGEEVTLQYRLNSGSWHDGSEVRITSDGTTTVGYRAIDSSGNVEPAHETTIRLDKTDPEISIPAQMSRDYGQDDTLTVDFDATDDLSGIDETTAAIDGHEVSHNQDISLNSYSLGTHTFEVTATDKAGNETVRETHFTVSNSADSDYPTTTAVYPAANSHGWYTGSVLVKFNVAENSEGDDIDYTQYQVNSGSWTKGTQVTVSAEGTNTVSYRSVDKEGHVEPTRELTLKVDSSRPQVTVDIEDNYQTGDTLTVDFTATDKISGIDSVEATLDGTAVSDGDKIDLDNYADGSHFLKVTAEDKAGNQTVKKAVFTIGDEDNSGTEIDQSYIEHITSDLQSWSDAGSLSETLVDQKLIKELEIADYHLDEGDWQAACGKLGSLINYVRAQSGKQIPVDIAKHLANDLETLRKQILQWQTEEQNVGAANQQRRMQHRNRFAYAWGCVNKAQNWVKNKAQNTQSNQGKQLKNTQDNRQGKAPGNSGGNKWGGGRGNGVARGRNK